ncbi:MAG: DNA-binding protein [Arcobacteraceae bacterium]|nr:DNA-binding protein [Arcobacteraceae bacterium]
MERLVSSSEAAQILGLSLQGVHYRIKQGKLKSKKTDGKIFVYLDDTVIKTKQISNNKDNLDNLLIVKDEQILFLKKSLKWMKKQYKSEINRLEKNQDKIVEVFQSEINLLQSAFNEMRNIYQISDKLNSTSSNNEKKESFEFRMMDIKDFFIFMKQNNKSDMEIKSIILDRIKQGDKRFIFNRQTKEVIIYKSDFIDLI